MKIKFNFLKKYMVLFFNIMLCFFIFKTKQINATETYSTNVDRTSVNRNEFVEKQKFEIYSSNDADALNNDAEKLFNSVNLFLKNAQNIDEQHFDDYCRNYILTNAKNKQTKIKSVSPEEFEKLKSNENYILVYRGINNKKFVESACNGDVYIGGPVRGVYFPCNASTTGNGIYTTTVLQHANLWAKTSSVEENESIYEIAKKIDLTDENSYLDTLRKNFNINSNNSNEGGIIQILVPKNLKIIDNKYLQKVFQTMVDKHAEFFKEYCDLLEKNKLPILNEFSSVNEKVLFNFVKKETGFDYLNDNSENKGEIFIQKLNNLIYPPNINLENLNNLNENERIEFLKTPFKEFLQKIKKLVEFEPNFETISKNSYLTNKLIALSQNSGLLTKLLNFDAVYEVPPYSNGNFVEDELNIVDFSDIIVCKTPLSIMK